MSSRSENIRFNVYLNDKQAGATTAGMYKQARILRSEINKLTIGSKAWINKMNELQYVNKNMQRIRGQMKGTNSIMHRLKGTISKFGPALGLGAGIALLSRLFGRVFGNIKKFDSNLHELSALTGMVGSNLAYLKNEAIKMSTATDKAGNKINMSASKILQAFKLVGSAKPELLKNKEGLAEVTKQAIILSQATNGKMGLEESVKSLTTIMNQFNAPAKEAGKFINVLAAGSKYGAGEITYLSKAYEQAGTVAKSANIPIERSTAIIELWAEKGLKAERAGVNFRNIIIELQKDTNNYTNGVFDMDKAMESLSKKQNNTIALTKQFGKENITAAQILAQGRKRVDELTKSLKGTNTAYEQSQENSKGLSFVIDRFSNKWSAFILKLDSGEGIISKVVTGIINMGSGLLNLITPANNSTKALEKERENVNRLAIRLTDVNTKENERKTILDKLKKINPDIVEGLKSENIEVKKLFKNLNKYNEAIANKIVLSQLDKKETKLLNKVGKIRADKVEQETDLLLKIKDVDENIISTKKTLAEKTKAAIDLLIKEGASVEEYAKKSDIYVNKNGVLIDNRSKEQEQLDEILLMSASRNVLLDKENKLMGDVSTFQNRINIIKELLGVQDDLNGSSSSSSSGSESDSSDTEIKKLQRLNEKIAELTHAQELGKMEANDREIQLIRDKYQKLIDAAKGYDEQIKSLEELRDADIKIVQAAQDEEFLAKKKEFNKKVKDITFEADVSELENRKEFLEQKLELARQNGEDTIALENEIGAIENNILEQKKSQEIEANQFKYDYLISVADQFGLDKAALLEAQKTSEKAINDKYNLLEIDGTKKKNAEIRKLESLSQKQKLQMAVQSMDAISGLFKEGSVAARVLASSSAIINTYLAATAALAPPPIGLGPVAGIPLAVSTVISGLANVAKINSVKFGKGGVSKGASHDEGGIHMIDSKTGKKVGEMEGGEPYMILSKKTYKNNRSLIDSLLDSSINHNGAKIDWMMPDYYSSPDLQNITSNLHNTKYAMGGTITNVNNVYNQQNPTTIPDNTALLSLTSEMLEELRNLKYLKTVLDLDGTLDLKEALDDIKNLETNAGL